MASHVTMTKEIPIIDEVDVLVVGAGISGCTAAVTAGRNGGAVALVDRFGFPGGNMGPAMIQGAPNLELPLPLAGGLPGIPGEFVRRCEGLCNAQLLNHYFRDSQVVSYVWLTMLEESGVQLYLNSFAGDPIMKGDAVEGIVIQNKSGAQAIRAKVTVDCTGDADVAWRAGAPVDEGTGLFSPGLYFALGNVNIETYGGLFDQEVSAEDQEWAEGVSPEVGRRVKHLRPLIPYLRAAWVSGEYRFAREIEKGKFILCDHGIFRSISGVQYVPNPIAQYEYDTVGAMVGVHGPESGRTSGDAAYMNRLEILCRKFIFETALFLRKRVPGFEKSYLHAISPLFHARGGRSIVSEYSLQVGDVEEQKKQEDVVFVGYTGLPRSSLGADVYGYPPEKSFDFPYRQFLPRNVENLLASGRSAIIQPPQTRTRWMVFLMGQAAGAAAALAAVGNTSPRKLDVKLLQSTLMEKHGVNLGDAERLRHLGLLERS